MTKKNPTPAEIIKAAEADILSRADEYAKGVADSRALAAERKQGADEAEAAYAALLTKLQNGDDSVSALDLVTSEKEVFRSDLLAKAAQTKAVRVAKATPNYDKRVAETIAEAVAEALPGIAVVPTFVHPDLPKDTNGLPVAFILQKGATTNNGGALSGDLELHYYRLPIHREFDPSRLTSAFDKRNWMVKVQTSQTHVKGEVEYDHVRFAVRSVYDEVPVIDHDAKELEISSAVQGIAQRFALATGATSEGVHVKSEPKPGQYNLGNFFVQWAEPKVSVKTVSGNRHTELEVGLFYGTHFVDSSSLGYTPQGIVNAIKAVKKHYDGRFIPGFGVVTAIESVATEGNQRTGFKLTAVSKPE
ncbi:hypothetical protein [Nocardiopsis halotolerans]|uniref:hypothetical protein n=1 Tax=Nocardiopsis halotolerans TaxID=124252 RepID=UPI0003460E30|nr:hypothetical protein [Nocardiopsis halotolerans]